MSRVCAILLLLILTGAARAQEVPDITPETPVDTATLHTWLVSLDPHLIAWAADFARRRHDAQIVSEIPPLLQQWSLPVLVGSPEELAGHQHVVLALLDTLIQENATVPLQVIESVADQFPAHALILINRLPPSDSKATLIRWTFAQNDRIEDPRARAAAMLLAVSPDPAFVHRVVQNLEQDLTVQLVNEDGKAFGDFGDSNVCGDSLAQPPQPGWPAVFGYHLREPGDSSDSTPGIPIAQIGRHSITAQRVDESAGWGGCPTVQSESAFRHELTAYWLNLKPDDMPWSPQESRAIVWSTQEDYQRQLGAITEEQRVKMLETFVRLHERSLLEALPEPRVVVKVECDLDPCPIGQPQ